GCRAPALRAGRQSVLHGGGLQSGRTHQAGRVRAELGGWSASLALDCREERGSAREQWTLAAERVAASLPGALVARQRYFEPGAADGADGRLALVSAHPSRDHPRADRSTLGHFLAARDSL